MASMLDRLDESRVFEAKIDGPGAILFVESCDSNFGDVLTPAEVDQLADELKDLAAKARAMMP